MINIELGSALIKGKRSLDKQLQEAIVDAIGDKLAVNRDTKRRMNPSFRKIMEGVKDNVVSNTPGKTLPTGWKIKTSRKTGELVYTLENDKAIRTYAPTGNVVDLVEVFEYGTGLYGRNRAKYPIVAKAAPELDFYYQSRETGAWDRYQGKGPVMHPGVKPTGMVRKGNAKLERDTRKALKSLESRFAQNARSSVAASPGPTGR